MENKNIQAGLAEAVRKIMQMDPEGDLFEGCIDDYPIADTGDYGSSWNQEKLEEFFGLKGSITSSPTNKVADLVECMYWDNVARQDEIKTFAELVKRLLGQIESGDIEKSKYSAFTLLHGWVDKYLTNN